MIKQSKLVILRLIVNEFDSYKKSNREERIDTMDKFMDRAVELSLENVRSGGTPFGAVLVKDGEIISEGVNELHHTYDSSGHAEMLAIRRAQAELKTLDLSDYTMYASGEPCPMCLSVMYISGIKKGYYCASVDEAAAVGMSISKEIYEDFKKDRAERKLVMKNMPLEEGQENPMDLWVEKNKS
ncbi:nucleoside deaminase [Carnobacterium sp. TMP28]|uniref:nucleoside deaminase n=1 Tax=Carnobacterium sp. TMP28 TaxID=3397060 RepID=UPI0039E0BCF3